jgi:hypothetical protein
MLPLENLKFTKICSDFEIYLLAAGVTPYLSALCLPKALFLFRALHTTQKLKSKRILDLV